MDAQVVAISDGSINSYPISGFGSGRSIQKLIAGESGKLFGSLGALGGVPGKSGLFKLSTASDTVSLLADNGNECGIPAMVFDGSSKLFAFTSPTGLVLLYDNTTSLASSVGDLSNWFGGATDAVVVGSITYVLRSSMTSYPPVPFITKFPLTGSKHLLTQIEFPSDITGLDSSVIPLTVVVSGTDIYIGTSISPMLLKLDTTNDEITFIARLNFLNSLSDQGTAFGNIRCMVINSSTSDIWGVVSGDPSKAPYIFKYTSGGVLSCEYVFDDDYIGSDVYCMCLDYADTTTTLTMGLRRGKDLYFGAEIVQWETSGSPGFTAAFGSTKNIYGEKAITALYHGTNKFYAGTAPSAILFSVGDSTPWTKTKIQTFGTGGSM